MLRAKLIGFTYSSVCVYLHIDRIQMNPTNVACKIGRICLFMMRVVSSFLKSVFLEIKNGRNKGFVFRCLGAVFIILLTFDSYVALLCASGRAVFGKSIANYQLQIWVGLSVLCFSLFFIHRHKCLCYYGFAFQASLYYW